jgi:hypothetical protein
MGSRTSDVTYLFTADYGTEFDLSVTDSYGYDLFTPTDVWNIDIRAVFDHSGSYPHELK